MTKRNQNHPFKAVFNQLGKDVGDINRRLAGIEQRLSTEKTEESTATKAAQAEYPTAISDLNEVLEALRKYQRYAKAEAAVKDKFLPYLSERIEDHQLTDEQRQALYSQMCQHLWKIQPPPNFGGGTVTVELPIPPQYQGKFAYTLMNDDGRTSVTYGLLTDKVEVQVDITTIQHDNSDAPTPVYCYLVIPDLSSKEAEVVDIPDDVVGLSL